jgi:hypothetical protein
LKIFIIIIITFLLIDFSYSQNKKANSESNFEFLPLSIIFEPIKANIYEAKNGMIKDLSKNALQLNLGISSDVVQWNSEKISYAIGADFFTYSNLRTEPNFKFPVDAIDYYFGLNSSFKRIDNFGILLCRLRISHISAHFEDGHKYERSDTIFTPVVYSREFVDISGGYDNWLLKNLKMKNQLGINILFHSIPDNFGILSFQYSFEFRYFLNSYLSIYLSNYLNFQRIQETNVLNENFETGFRIGNMNSKGLSVSFNYYDGKDYKGQYYDNYLNYKAIGFNVDL